MGLKDDFYAAGNAVLAAFEAKSVKDLASRDDEINKQSAQITELTNLVAQAISGRDAALTEASLAKQSLAERDALIASLRARIAELEAPTTPPLNGVSRPTGARYIAIEDLGVPITPEGIQQAVMLGAKVKDKIITLPPGEFRFNGFGMGSGRFVAGIQINRDTNPNAPLGLSGSYDIVTGEPLTGLGMVPNSSQFKTEAEAYQGNTSQSGQVYSQSLQAVVRLYKVPGETLMNLKLLQADMQHWYHGFRLEGGVANQTAYNYLIDGGNFGGGNMPPGETYSWMVDGPNYSVKKIRHLGKYFTSTSGGVLSSSGGTIEDVYVQELRSGFPVVYWNTTGTHTIKNIEGRRLGTGPRGMNGCLINFEGCQGDYTVDGAVIELDGAWPNPMMSSGKRANPGSNVTPRHEGKFPHFIVLDGGFDGNRAPKITIREPKWIGGFGFKGALGIYREALPNALIKIILDGKEAAPVYRSQWWVEPSAFTNPRTQYQVADEANQSTIWG